MSVLLFIVTRSIGLACTPLSMEPAAAFLELWDRSVPSDIGIAGLNLLPPEVEASYVLLLCMLVGIICWSRCWVGVTMWLLLQLDLALGDFVASADWAAWGGGSNINSTLFGSSWEEHKQHYSSVYVGSCIVVGLTTALWGVLMLERRDMPWATVSTKTADRQKVGVAGT